MCMEIDSGDSAKIRLGIDKLASFNSHSPVTIEATQKAIIVAKNSIASQTEYYQSQISLIKSNLEIAITNLSSISSKTPQKVSKIKKITIKILEIIEAFLDAGDAVKRRKKSDKIYRDLINFHISHKRASTELQKITKRQKGGWFVSRFD